MWKKFATFLLASFLFAVPAQAAVTIVERVAESNTDQNDADYTTTTTWSFASTSLGVCAVAATDASGTSADTIPSLAHTGYSWDRITGPVGFDLVASPSADITLFRAKGTGAAAAALTATFTGDSQTSIAINCFEVTGVDLTGTNGENAIRQFKTINGDATDPLSVTFDSATLATGGIMFFAGTQSSATWTPDTSYSVGTEIAYSAPTMEWKTQYIVSTADNNPVWDFAATENSAGIAVELAVESAGTPSTAPNLLLLGSGKQAVRSRIGTVADAFYVQITSPTFQDIYETDTTALTVSGNASNATSVNWTCNNCTVTSGTATLTGGNFSFGVTLGCSASPGTTNVITAIGNRGVDQVNDTLTALCVTPDAGNPTVTITTNNGANFSTSASSVTLNGTCTDPELVCTLVREECATCSPTQKDATFLGGGQIDWGVSFTLASGANTIVMRGFDEAGNQGTDSIVVTRNPPVQITTPANLGTCTEDAACSRTLLATGGVTPYTWSEVGSSLGTGNCTGLSLADSGDNGALSGPANPSSVPVVCTFTARVTDSTGGTPLTYDQVFTLNIVAAGAETFETFFNYQVDNRSTCDINGNGTNCIVRLLSKAGGEEACPDATYGDKGACTLRNMAQLNLFGSSGASNGSEVNSVLRKFHYNYGSDSYVNKQDAAKVVIPGESEAACPEAAPPAGQGVGCADIKAAEQLHAKIPPTNSGTLTIYLEAWWGNEWKQSGFDPDIADTEPGINCGGEAGSSKRWKHIRIDGSNGGWISVTKLDFAQSASKKYHKLDFTDSGWWDCDDNYIAVVGGGSGGLGKNVVTPDGKVAPTDIGIVNNDQTFEPNGPGVYHTYESKDFPIRAATWTSFIFHIDLHVPADDPRLNDWRNGCDNRGDAKWISTSSIANPTVITTAVNHQLQTGDTVYIYNHEGGQSGINGAHTVTRISATTFSIPINATVAGHDGIVVKDNLSAIDTECANMLATIPDPDNTSIWNLNTLVMCDETRGCQMLNNKVPWHTMAGTDTDPRDTALQVIRFAELDGSAQGCGGGCGNRHYYIRNLIVIRNINNDDINYAGCPDACIGDTGPVNSNLFRKPKGD